MNRKIIAAVLLLLITCTFTTLMGEPLSQYGYVLGKCRASPELILTFEVGAAAIGFAFGPPGLAFSLSYASLSIA